jgi:hypothetical protein
MSEFDSIGNYVEAELPQYTQIDRIYPSKVGRELRESRSSRFYTGVEHGYILERLTDWNDKAVDEMAAKNPRIVIPVELSSNTEDIKQVVLSLPYIPYARSDVDQNVIIAAGIPLQQILTLDDPTHLDDDAVRDYAKKIHSAHDPGNNELVTKINGYAYEKGIEKGMVMGSNVITLLRLIPPLTIPIMLARGVLNAKDIAHNHIHHIQDRIPAFDDPDTYARFMRLTKPFLEKTDDHEFQDAVVLLKMPETLSWLKEHAIEGDTLAIAEKEHASGVNFWNSYDKQAENFTQAIQDIIAIRKELAHTLNKRMHPEDWEAFSDELIEHFGGVTIFGVNERPPHPSIEAVSNQIPVLYKFISKKIERLVKTTVAKELGHAVPPSEEDNYPGSDMNDF